MECIDETKCTLCDIIIDFGHKTHKQLKFGCQNTGIKCERCSIIINDETHDI